MLLTNQSPWLVSLKRHAVGILSVLLLVSWASLLTVPTIQLQHSCKPLLEWTDISATKCPSDPSDNTSKPDKHKPGEGLKTPPSEPPGGNISDKRDWVGIAAGSAAIVGLAVIGAPVAVVAGVGVAVWLATRTLLS